MSGSIGDILNDILSDKEKSEALSAALVKLRDGVSQDMGEVSQDMGEEVENQSQAKSLTEEASQSLKENSAQKPLSEKQLMLERKIQILEALKPLFGQDFSKKADLIINALNAAKIILGFKQ